MKTSLTALFLIISTQVFAQNIMSYAERDNYLEDVAKKLRRSMHIAGHDDVSSHITYPSKEDLDDYFSDDQYYESDLDRDEIKNIYKCFDAKRCRVYHIATSSSYWGGYGVEGTFVLLYIYNRAHSEMTHTIYSE